MTSKNILFNVLILFVSCTSCKEDHFDEETNDSFNLKVGVILDPIEDSNGIEIYNYTYYHEKDITLRSLKHFDMSARLNDTLIFNVTKNNIQDYVKNGDKVTTVFGISRAWDDSKPEKKFYRWWHFGTVIIDSKSDSVLLYSFPMDTISTFLGPI